MAGTKGVRPPAAGMGRKKGVPNKNTVLVKDMIMAALDRVGGVDYLAKQAIKNPVPFLALVGRVLPFQITGGDGQPLQIKVVHYNGMSGETETAVFEPVVNQPRLPVVIDVEPEPELIPSRSIKTNGHG